MILFFDKRNKPYSFATQNVWGHAVKKREKCCWQNYFSRYRYWVYNWFRQKKRKFQDKKFFDFILIRNALKPCKLSIYSLMYTLSSMFTFYTWKSFICSKRYFSLWFYFYAVELYLSLFFNFWFALISYFVGRFIYLALAFFIFPSLSQCTFLFVTGLLLSAFCP